MVFELNNSDILTVDTKKLLKKQIVTAINEGVSGEEIYRFFDRFEDQIRREIYLILRGEGIAVKDAANRIENNLMTTALEDYSNTNASPINSEKPTHSNNNEQTTNLFEGLNSDDFSSFSNNGKVDFSLFRELLTKQK